MGHCLRLPLPILTATTNKTSLQRPNTILMPSLNKTIARATIFQLILTIMHSIKVFLSPRVLLIHKHRMMYGTTATQHAEAAKRWNPTISSTVAGLEVGDVATNTSHGLTTQCL